MDPSRLRPWLDERVSSHAFSGVALVWRDGGPVFSYAGGLADRGHGVRVVDDSRFAIASITKVATATAALRLVERGLVHLDSPLKGVLPPDWQPAALTDAHVLRHLLSHTSGLANYHDDAATTWASYTSCWDRIPPHRIRRLADMLPLFVDLPAVRPPGEAFQYGDVNFVLVALVIEAVTGRPFGDVVAEEVWIPAGMVDSGFDPLDEDPPRLATGYLVSEAPPATWRTNLYSVPAVGMGDGGMITTAPDLARLVDALHDGRLLSPPSIAAMTRPQGPPSGELERYGYGLELVVEHDEVTILGHGGSDPGISTELWRYRSDGSTIVVLCNQDRGAWAVAKELALAFGLGDPRS